MPKLFEPEPGTRFHTWGEGARWVVGSAVVLFLLAAFVGLDLPTNNPWSIIVPGAASAAFWGCAAIVPLHRANATVTNALLNYLAALFALVAVMASLNEKPFQVMRWLLA